VFVFTFVMDQEINLDDLHPLLGNAVVLTGVLVTLGGLATAYFMGFSDMSWKTNTVLLIRGLHSKFAYATLLVSQAAIMTGIILHFGLTNPQLGKMLVICNLTGYIAVLGLFEVCHRRMLIQEDPFRKVD